MKLIALIAALACAAPAFADGQRIVGKPTGSPELGLKAQAGSARAKDTLDRMDDLIAKRCNDAGGGMMTTNEGTYRCVGPDGNDIPNY